MVVSAKQLRKNNLLSVGMLEFVQQLATLPFSAGEAVRELSGNLSPLASPGLKVKLISLILGFLLIAK